MSLPLPQGGNTIPNGPELIIVIAVLVLLFGAKKIPELARSVGTSVRELKRGMNEADEDLAAGRTVSAREFFKGLNNDDYGNEGR